MSHMTSKKPPAWYLPDILRRLRGTFMAKYLSMLNAVRVNILDATATPAIYETCHHNAYSSALHTES